MRHSWLIDCIDTRDESGDVATLGGTTKYQPTIASAAAWQRFITTSGVSFLEGRSRQHLDRNIGPVEFAEQFHFGHLIHDVP